ncbi:LANO_0A02476g1_1 [Lachancea nothofagi CBS 11611]|uniref:LANO_0A02476g1_1 n=1 Tax=Lachancea nothofagi CBS 11611 TaxID=1266666 RepID=A0A1G4INK0_9SACH|nr:LANO_0A02476g1_1 [Lachancea nothofagi CBS 11611]
MTTEYERQPLGTVSSSRMNRLNGKASVESGAKVAALGITKLPSIMSLIHQDSNLFPAHREREGGEDMTLGSVVDFDQVSQKLKIRMQLAHYKLKTKQAHLKFKQLSKPQSSRDPGHARSHPFETTLFSKAQTSNTVAKPPRRLVMSQGSLKTPVKSRLWNSNSYDSRPSLQTTDSDQATPKSVKAAKSLIDLFTSNH